MLQILQEIQILRRVLHIQLHLLQIQVEVQIHHSLQIILQHLVQIQAEVQILHRVLHIQLHKQQIQAEVQILHSLHLTKLLLRLQEQAHEAQEQVGLQHQHLILHKQQQHK